MGLKAPGMGAGSPLDSVVLPHSAGPYEPRLFRKAKGEAVGDVQTRAGVD